MATYKLIADNDMGEKFVTVKRIVKYDMSKKPVMRQTIHKKTGLKNANAATRETSK